MLKHGSCRGVLNQMRQLNSNYCNLD